MSNATPEQIRAALVKKVHELKAESHNAVNVYKIKEVLQGMLDVLDVLLTGRANIVQPNQVPGLPVGQDPNKQHVEFFQTPDQQSGASDLASGGQRVELFSTPGTAPSEPVRSADATSGQIVPSAATRNVEAGRGEEVPLLPGQARNKEELLASLPIPILQG